MLRTTDHSARITDHPVKAMVLAAGLGTRLRPFTQDKPKCLMPLAGRPLIDWTLRWLVSCGITECVINLHYCPEKVRDFVGEGNAYGLGVRYSYEQKLLGTAGAVKKVADFFDQPFYVIYSDNFSQWNLRELKDRFDKTHPVAAMAVHWRDDVTQSGMIEFDQSNRILRMVEKPKPDEVTSHYVSAGFFYLHPGVLDYVPENEFYDFGFDVFPKMLKQGEHIYAVKMEDPIIGIDTVEAYKRANQLALTLGNAI